MSGNASPFHRGEKEIQLRLGVGDRIEQLGRRMIQPGMPDRHQGYFSQLPLLFVGTADASGRPWASALAGPPGFLQPFGADILRVQARPIYGDPLNRALVEGSNVGTLGLDFETRNRVRANGVITDVGEDQFEIRVAQSYGNCPQYIQAREPVLELGIEPIGEKRPVRRGKTPKQALTAVMRKLVHLCYGVAKNNQSYQEQFAA